MGIANGKIWHSAATHRICPAQGCQQSTRCPAVALFDWFWPLRAKRNWDLQCKIPFLGSAAMSLEFG